MSKHKTTGGPRPHRTTRAELERRKQYKSRAEREQMWQRRALYIVGGLVAASLIILLGAIIYQEIIIPSQEVSIVNGDEIKTEDFQERVRFMRWLTAQQVISQYLQTGDDQTVNQYAMQLQNHKSFGAPILEEMEEQVLMEQEVEARGLEVDEAAVDQRVDEFMANSLAMAPLPDPDATPTTAPTATPTPLVSPTPRPTATLAPTAIGAAPADAADDAGDDAGDADAAPADAADDAAGALEPTVEPTLTPTTDPAAIQATLDEAADTFFERASDGADVSRDVVRDVFYYDALRATLTNDMLADIPTAVPQVNARHILIAFDPNLPSGQMPPPPSDEQRAAAEERFDKVQAALDAGEPFADLAKTFSDDTGSAQNGGNLGWADPESYTANFQDAVQTAEIGEIIRVETEFGLHIIQVLARDDARPLSVSERDQRASQAFQSWLTEAKQNADVDRRDDWQDRIPENPSVDKLFEELLG
jgi:hypothetical protein